MKEFYVDKLRVVVADTRDEMGAIAAADVLKTDSMEAVAAMKKLHLDVVMLTGDNEKTASTIAEIIQLEAIAMCPNPTPIITDGIAPIVVKKIYLGYFTFKDAAKKQISP